MNDLGNDVMWIDMTKILSNKSTYEGEFKENEPHGKGVNTLPNGMSKKVNLEKEVFGMELTKTKTGIWFQMSLKEIITIKLI